MSCLVVDYHSRATCGTVCWAATLYTIVTPDQSDQRPRPPGTPLQHLLLRSHNTPHLWCWFRLVILDCKTLHQPGSHFTLNVLQTLRMQIRISAPDVANQTRICSHELCELMIKGFTVKLWWWRGFVISRKTHLSVILLQAPFLTTATNCGLSVILWFCLDGEPVHV